MVEVIVTDEFKEWYESLAASPERGHVQSVTFVVGLLEARGVSLGHPYTSAIKGSKHPLRELRVRSGPRVLRVFYAFDPRRQAVLLLGGDKTGDDLFYERYVPRAERLWEEYLANQTAEEEQKEEGQ